jgi:hypothetical protein
VAIGDESEPGNYSYQRSQLVSSATGWIVSSRPELMAAEDGELVQAFWQGESDGFVCRLVLVEHNTLVTW